MALYTLYTCDDVEIGVLFTRYLPIILWNIARYFLDYIKTNS